MQRPRARRCSEFAARERITKSSCQLLTASDEGICFQVCANEIRNFWRDVGWRGDAEYRALRYRLQGDGLPGCGIWCFVQDYGAGAVQKFARRVFEICGCGIEH